MSKIFVKKIQFSVSKKFVKKKSVQYVKKFREKVSIECQNVHEKKSQHVEKCEKVIVQYVEKI